MDEIGRFINKQIANDSTAPSNPKNLALDFEADLDAIIADPNKAVGGERLDTNLNQGDFESELDALMVNDSNPYMNYPTDKLYKLQAELNNNVSDAVRYSNDTEFNPIGDPSSFVDALATGYVDNTINAPAALSGILPALAPYTPLGAMTKAVDKQLGTKLFDAYEAPGKYIQEGLERNTAKLLGFNDYKDYQKSVEDIASKSAYGYVTGAVLPDIIASGKEVLTGAAKASKLAADNKVLKTKEGLDEVLRQADEIINSPKKEDIAANLPDMSEAYDPDAIQAGIKAKNESAVETTNTGGRAVNNDTATETTTTKTKSSENSQDSGASDRWSFWGATDNTKDMSDKINPEWVKAHEDAMNADVVYYSDKHKVGLLRPKGSTQFGAVGEAQGRTRVDIDAYKGNAFSPEQIEDLKRAKKEIMDKENELANQTKGKLFENGNVAASETVDPQAANFVKEMLNLFGIKRNVFLFNTKDINDPLAASKYYLHGTNATPLSRVNKSNVLGGLGKMGDGYFLHLDASKINAKSIETLAHELGHLFEYELYEGESLLVRSKVMKAYSDWLKVMEQPGRTIHDTYKGARSFSVSENLVRSSADGLVSNVSKADMHKFTSFSEWFADNTAKWATTNTVPLTIVDKFFKKVANMYKRLYTTIVNKGYAPNAAFEEWINSKVNKSNELFGDQAKDFVTKDQFSDLNVPELGRQGRETKSNFPFESLGIERLKYDEMRDVDLNTAAQKLIDEKPDIAEQFMKSNDAPVDTLPLQRRVGKLMIKQKIVEEKEFLSLLDEYTKIGKSLGRALRDSWDPIYNALKQTQALVRSGTPKKIQDTLDNVDGIKDGLDNIEIQAVDEMLGKGPGLGEGKGPGLGEGKGPGLGEGKGPGLGEGKGPGLGEGKGPGLGEGKGPGLGGVGQAAIDKAKKKIKELTGKNKRLQNNIDQIKKDNVTRKAYDKLKESRDRLNQELRDLKFKDPEAVSDRNIPIKEGMIKESANAVGSALKPAKMPTETDILANRVLSFVKQAAKEKGIIKEAGPKDDIFQVIGQGLENTKEYREIYTEVQKRIETELTKRSMTDPQAIEQMTQAREFLDNLMTKPYTNAQTQKALQEAFKWSGVTTEDLAKMYWKNRNQAKDTMADFIHKVTGVDRSKALQFEQDFRQALNQKVRAKQEQLLDKVLNPVTRNKKTKKSLTDKVIELHNLGALESQPLRDKFAEHFKIPTLTNDQTKTIQLLAEKAQQLPKGSREQNVVRGLLTKVMVSTVPATNGQKLKALQDIWFLSSTGTHIVNTTGNLVKAGMDLSSDFVAATILDPIDYALTGRSDYGLKNGLKNLVNGFKKDAQEGFEDAVLGIDTKQEVNALESVRNKQVFDNEILEAARRIIYGSLQVSDRAFYGSRYAVVKGQLEAANIKRIKAGKVKPYTADEIEIIAQQEALEATFQHHIKFGKEGKEYDLSQNFLDLRKTLNSLTGDPDMGIGSLVVPFLNTPTNVVGSTISYSPLGLLKLAVGADKSSRNVKKTIARAIVGTGITGAGALGAYTGVYHPTMQDPNYTKNSRLVAMNQEQGIQPSSLDVGEYNVGLGRVQPVASNADLGANLVNNFQQRPGLENALSNIGNAYKGQASGLLELPMVQSAKSLTEFARDPNRQVSNIIPEIGRRIVPSGIKSLERMVDPNYHDTYDPNLGVQLINEAQAGIPFLGQELPNGLAVFGRASLRSQDEPLLRVNNALSPFTIEKLHKDKRLQNIEKLYRSQGNAKILPNDNRDNTITVNGKIQRLTADERHRRQAYVGTRFDTYSNELYSNPEFLKLSPEQQGQAIAKINDAIEATANEMIGKKYTDIDAVIKKKLLQEFSRENNPYTSTVLKSLIKSNNRLGNQFVDYNVMEDKAKKVINDLRFSR